MCVRECECVSRAANLLVVGQEMHHNGVICSGVANGSNSGLSHVMETRLGQGALELALQANKRVTHAYHDTYALCYLCIHYSAQGGPRTRDHTIVLG